MGSYSVRAGTTMSPEGDVEPKGRYGERPGYGRKGDRSRNLAHRMHPSTDGATIPLARHMSLRTPTHGTFRAAALLVLVAGIVLAYMIPEGLTGRPVYAQTAASSLALAENGTAPVATFLAYDQDGEPIRWSLSGPDHALFTIDGGTLAFREPPTTRTRSPGRTGTCTGWPSW